MRSLNKERSVARGFISSAWLKGEEMGSSYGRQEVRQEPDVPEEIARPKAAKDWSSRRLEVQCFGVVRHASRADTIGATWNGTRGKLGPSGAIWGLRLGAFSHLGVLTHLEA